MMAKLSALREELAAAEAGVKEAIRVRDAALEALTTAESQVPLAYYEVVSAPSTGSKRRRRIVLPAFGEVDVALISASALLESRQLSGGDRWPPGVTAPSTEELAEGDWARQDPPMGGAPSVLVGDTLLVHKDVSDARMILVIRNNTSDTFAAALRFCPADDATPTAHLSRLSSKAPPPKQLVPAAAHSSGGGQTNVASLLLRQLANSEQPANNNNNNNNGSAATHAKKEEEQQQRRPNNSIFIGNITRGAIHDVELSLRQHFGRCGRIVDMRIAETYAHIDFDNVASATRAKELNGTVLGPRRIRVDYADQRRSNNKQASGGHQDRYGPPRRGGPPPQQQMPPTHQRPQQLQQQMPPYAHQYQPPSMQPLAPGGGYSAPGTNYRPHIGAAGQLAQMHQTGPPQQLVNQQQPYLGGGAGGGVGHQDELDAYM